MIIQAFHQVLPRSTNSLQRERLPTGYHGDNGALPGQQQEALTQQEEQHLLEVYRRRSSRAEGMGSTREELAQLIGDIQFNINV